MKPIHYIERTTGKTCTEEVYGGSFLNFLYGDTFLSKILGEPLSHCLARIPAVSQWYGKLQSSPASAKRVLPFIDKFGVDTTEFAKQAQEFTSFNDFFTRELKPDARPIAKGTDTAIIPADGRYLFHQNIAHADGFVVKGQKFDLKELLQDEKLAEKYADGAMVMARLCPTDYHRFHFPCDCIPGTTETINGHLYSVNPVAIRKNIGIFAENKRTLCKLATKEFGTVLYMEIGATCVGTIHETYTPGIPVQKGAEKGYFSFGGSSLILLFERDTITFDRDLLEASAKLIEIKCLMGQSMGKSHL